VLLAYDTTTRNILTITGSVGPNARRILDGRQNNGALTRIIVGYKKRTAGHTGTGGTIIISGLFCLLRSEWYRITG
jgi:hypothetical protein